MTKRDKLVHGVGINDADYKVTRSNKINGKFKRVWKCPYYAAWAQMLRRCYSEVILEKYPTYVGCHVCEEWKRFSNFKAWMEAQDWEGKDLDKDTLIEGNKLYSPDTCRFVDHSINTFLLDCGAARGEFPIGVHFHKAAGKFQAYCRNPFTGVRVHLGLFTCPKEAHEAWKKKKYEHACALADLQADVDVAEALRNRFK